MRIRTLLLLASMLSIAGCAVGYKTFRTDVPDVSAAPVVLDKVRLAYYSDNVLLRLAFERVGAERFQVREMMPLKTPSEPDPGGRFVISARRIPKKEEPGIFYQIWGGSSMLFFAVVPFCEDERSTIELSLSSRQQTLRKIEYQATVRSYSWLPFGLFGPDYLFFLNGPATHEELEFQDGKIRMYERIITRFMTDVSPLLQQQATAQQ